MHGLNVASLFEYLPASTFIFLWDIQQKHGTLLSFSDLIFRLYYGYSIFVNWRGWDISSGTDTPWRLSVDLDALDRCSCGFLIGATGNQSDLRTLPYKNRPSKVRNRDAPWVQRAATLNSCHGPDTRIV